MSVLLEMIDRGRDKIRQQTISVCNLPTLRGQFVNPPAFASGSEPQERGDARESTVMADGNRSLVSQSEELGVLLKSVRNREFIGKLVISLDGGTLRGWRLALYGRRRAHAAGVAPWPPASP